MVAASCEGQSFEQDPREESDGLALGDQPIISMRATFASLQQSWVREAGASADGLVRVDRASAVMAALFDRASSGNRPLIRLPAVSCLTLVTSLAPYAALDLASAMAPDFPYDVVGRFAESVASEARKGIPPQGYALLRSLLVPDETSAAAGPVQLPSAPHVPSPERETSGLPEAFGGCFDLDLAVGRRVRYHLQRPMNDSRDREFAKALGYPWPEGSLEKTERKLRALEERFLTSPPLSSASMTKAVFLQVTVQGLTDSTRDPGMASDIARSLGCDSAFDLLSSLIAVAHALEGKGSSPERAGRVLAASALRLLQTRPKRDIEVTDLTRGLVLALQALGGSRFAFHPNFLATIRQSSVVAWADLEQQRMPALADSRDLPPGPASAAKSTLENVRVARVVGLAPTRASVLDYLGATERNSHAPSLLCGTAPGLSRTTVLEECQIRGARIRIFDSQTYGQFRPHDGFRGIVKEVKDSGAYPAIERELEIGGVSLDFLAFLLRREPHINLPELELICYSLQHFRSCPAFPFDLFNFSSIAGSSLVRAIVETADETFRLASGYIGTKPHSGDGAAHILDGRKKQIGAIAKRVSWKGELSDFAYRFLRDGVLGTLAYRGGEVPSGRAPEFYTIKSAPYVGLDGVIVSVLLANLPPELVRPKCFRSPATAIVHSSPNEFKRYMGRQLHELSDKVSIDELARHVSSVAPVLEESGAAPLRVEDVVAGPVSSGAPPQVPDSERGSIAPRITAEIDDARVGMSHWYRANVLLPRIAQDLYFLLPV